MELRCLRKGSFSYGLGADFSLPHCLVGDRVSESNLEPVAYWRLVGAKAINLGSCDKHPAYCLDLNVDVWHMRSVINGMEYFKPGELLKVIYNMVIQSRMQQCHTCINRAQ